MIKITPFVKDPCIVCSKKKLGIRTLSGYSYCFNDYSKEYFNKKNIKHVWYLIKWYSYRKYIKLYENR